jgi:excisionase family DNA binding protein
MTEPDELLSVAEIASELKMNQQTLRNWIDSVFLPAIRTGRRVRVKRSDCREAGRLTATPSTLNLGASAGAPAIIGTAAPESWRDHAVSDRKTNRGRLGARS